MIGRETSHSWICGDPDPVRDPSLLDPASTSQNFETTTRDPYVYYKIFNLYGGCSAGPDRDQLRHQIRFNGTVPVASFTATPSPALIGNTVALNASGSSDPGSNPITNYDWDLDGNGTFETFNGSNPILNHTFTRAHNGKIGLRVTDSETFHDMVWKQVDVNGNIDMKPDWGAIPATYAEEIGLPYSDTRGSGWVRQDSLTLPTHAPLDLSANARDRDRSDVDQFEQKLDSLIFMQYPSSGLNRNVRRTRGAWEMAVPCGTYTVTVGVGDSRYKSSSTDPANFSTHRINVEGQNLIAGFVPSDSNRFTSASTTVPVCDGRLTVDANGGANTKLNYIDVSRPLPKIDMQPDFASAPSSYAEDMGGAFSDTRGYGWVRQDSLSTTTHVPLDLSPNTRDRDLSDTDAFEQKLDTLTYMQYPTSGLDRNARRTRGAWEMTVPCGTYTVTVGVGDSSFKSTSTDPGNFSTNRINVEGVNAIAGFVPTDGTKFASATSTAVPVCDGRLTIDAVGGSNTKLNYVEVTPLSIIG